MTQETQKTVRVNLKLPVLTHARMKAWCAMKGVSIQQALTLMLSKRFSEDPK